MSTQTCRLFRSQVGMKPFQDLVERDRNLSNAHAGRIEHGIRDDSPWQRGQRTSMQWNTLRRRSASASDDLLDKSTATRTEPEDCFGIVDLIGGKDATSAPGVKLQMTGRGASITRDILKSSDG